MEATSRDTMANSSGSNTYFIVSILLLIIVICISAFLWVLNINAQKQITDANSKITEYNKQIEEFKSNNEIAAYDIVFASKADIIKNIEKSQAQTYVNEILSLSKKYKMAFTGFSFNWENISTNATYVNRDIKDDSMTWVSSFIKDFRTTAQSMFNLGPISSVSWDSLKRTFAVSFDLLK